MLEKLKYINHMNEVLEFGDGKLFINENDLRDFAWEITSKNDKISGFKKGIVTKTVPIIVKCDSKEEGISLKNKLFEVFEKDVLAVKHGRFVIGDYYLKCFVTESAKSEYLIHKNYLKITVKVSTDLPYWFKETTLVFNHGENDSVLTGDLDFNRDFSYDYASNLIGKELKNTNFVSTNFKINIYGLCENPKITIAGHDYGVSASIGENEYLTIDSVNKTIVLTKVDGTKENYFNKRNRDSYIFEKIPSGLSNVSANNVFKFDVVLLEERSEPKWI
jgi:hypothetical protein